MREIKFRAWRYGTKVLSRVNRLELDNGRVIGALLYDTEDKEFSLPIDAFVLMQYTGSKDKNGKEGYFDDLVQWGRSIYQVVWDETKGTAHLVKQSGTEVFSSLPIRMIRESKVIGNIYEGLYSGENMKILSY